MLPFFYLICIHIFNIMKLFLYNSLTRTKSVFCPIDIKLVKMYVCGPTVYDHPHIGNARSVVVYDILYRILIKLFGYNHVRYVRNITDIDDKIIMRANKDQISVSALTKKTTSYFHNDMDYLGCKRPNIEPKATDHIQDMIEIINKLLQRNIAYKSGHHVYFDVSKAQNYYQLSGRSTFEDMLKQPGINTKLHDAKKNLEDFVLWKPSSRNEEQSTIFFSPFGEGRPGWHIECSAMSNKYLGQDFDIHGGGADLIFPHHTNEIAQSCLAFPGSSFAKIWVHNGFLTVNHRKMSKSLGNFTTIQDLRKKNIKGDVIRLFLLSNHYRKPINLTDKAIFDAHTIISYWYRAIENLPDLDIVDISEEFFNYLLDDMNISGAITIITQLAKQIHLEQCRQEKKRLASQMLSCAKFIGVMREPAETWFQCSEKQDNIDNKNTVQYINHLLAQRSIAKKQQDWQLADKIRQELMSMQIEIEDRSDGTSMWKRQRAIF